MNIIKSIWIMDMKKMVGNGKSQAVEDMRRVKLKQVRRAW